MSRKTGLIVAWRSANFTKPYLNSSRLPSRKPSRTSNVAASSKFGAARAFASRFLGDQAPSDPFRSRSFWQRRTSAGAREYIRINTPYPGGSPALSSSSNLINSLMRRLTRFANSLDRNTSSGHPSRRRHCRLISFFRILQANRRGDGERCGRRKNGRGGEGRVRNRERGGDSMRHREEGSHRRREQAL